MGLFQATILFEDVLDWVKERRGDNSLRQKLTFQKTTQNSKEKLDRIKPWSLRAKESTNNFGSEITKKSIKATYYVILRNLTKSPHKILKWHKSQEKS